MKYKVNYYLKHTLLRYRKQNANLKGERFNVVNGTRDINRRGLERGEVKECSRKKWMI